MQLRIVLSSALPFELQVTYLDGLFGQRECALAFLSHERHHFVVECDPRTPINSVYQPSLRKVPATGVLHRSSGSAVVAESTIEWFTASHFTQSTAQQLLVPVGELVDSIG